MLPHPRVAAEASYAWSRRQQRRRAEQMDRWDELGTASGDREASEDARARNAGHLSRDEALESRCRWVPVRTGGAFTAQRRPAIRRVRDGDGPSATTTGYSNPGLTRFPQSAREPFHVLSVFPRTSPLDPQRVRNREKLPLTKRRAPRSGTTRCPSCRWDPTSVPTLVAHDSGFQTAVFAQQCRGGKQARSRSPRLLTPRPALAC